MISLDTETTGLDLYHSCKPFLVTIGNEDKTQDFWEWTVDPVTREPQIPKVELNQVIDRLEQAFKSEDWVVLQNPKFDYTGLCQIDKRFAKIWKWNKVFDTLLASHLVKNDEPHDLTWLALEYLFVDILPYETNMRTACTRARAIAKSRFPNWVTARKGIKGMPSAKEKAWKCDTWLPKLLAETLKYPEDHPWHTVTEQYANVDSAVTLELKPVLERIIKENGYWKVFKKRLEIPAVATEMENFGVTLNRGRVAYIKNKHQRESTQASQVCLSIAKKKGVDLVLPKSGVNKSLKAFLTETLALPPVSFNKKTKKPSLDKRAMDIYQETLPKGSQELLFIQNLAAKRKRDTAINQLMGYERFWVKISGPRVDGKSAWQLWVRLHPSLNPTGTNTLRWSSNNPNEQNISKQGMFQGDRYSSRYCFGPAPDREWWSCDAQNIELRIPAYEAGEEAMIDIFENPDRPPYFGSYHLLIFDLLHPEKFAKHGMKCKDVYEPTWYQWTKNGNFAVSYGSVESSGTADRSYHVPGGFLMVKKRFTKIHGPGGLNDKMIAHAEEFGYVETIPDKTVDPKHGYPLWCERTRNGNILPTVPLNYHVQGSAMWWMVSAMLRCHEYLMELSKKRKKKYAIIMQVHDELVFDFPRGKTLKENKPVIEECMRLMRMGGDDIGVPTPVSCKLHLRAWSQGLSV